MAEALVGQIPDRAAQRAGEWAACASQGAAQPCEVGVAAHLGFGLLEQGRWVEQGAEKRLLPWRQALASGQQLRGHRLDFGFAHRVEAGIICHG